MSFPVIKTADDFLANTTIPYTKTDGGEFESFCHEMGIPVSLYATQYDIEARGITFDRGDIFHRTMHKFFNAGEGCPLEEINWDIWRIMEKLDGSMISAGVSQHSGRMLVKSKKSFDSVAAQGAQKFINENRFASDFIHSLKGFATPIFEWIDPAIRVVVFYDKPSLTLLHVRNNVTGEYLDINQFSYPHKVREYDSSLTQIQQMLAEKENFEGVVVQNKNGEMYKFKTEWYRALHNREIKFSERNIAARYLNETLDDLKPSFGPALFAEVNRVERKIFDMLQNVKNQAAQLANEYPHNPRAFVEKYIHHPLFGIAVRVARGQETESQLLAYFKKHLLKTLSNDHIKV